MAKEKSYKLKSMTDIKIFLLFVLDTIRYPTSYSTLTKILYENTEAVSIDYEECLGELVDRDHVYFDEFEGERYYMISDKGREVSAELYDTLDPVFRERSIRATMKYLSLERTGTTIHSEILTLPDQRYEVVLSAKDAHGPLFSLRLTVNSHEEAVHVRNNFEERPDGLYRGILFSASGRIGYLP